MFFHFEIRDHSHLKKYHNIILFANNFLYGEYEDSNKLHNTHCIQKHNLKENSKESNSYCYSDTMQ